jgi:uncharacterized protein (TIGR02301 family)
MPKRTIVILAAAVVSALAPPAAAQNLLDRATAPPRYEQRQRYYEERVPRASPPQAPAPASAALPAPGTNPAAPGTSPAAPPGANPATPATGLATPGSPGVNPAQPGATPAAEEPAPPYEPQLLRLSELLGALTYLQDLCGGESGQVWRDKMSALMDAETQNEIRRERLAGAYNRGFNGYELSYRQCTPNAQAIITRFLDESSKIARDVTHRYGTS